MLLLLSTTWMRVGEALVLDYEKDINLNNAKIDIRKTQTKNISDKAIIGETAKNENGERYLIGKEIFRVDFSTEVKNSLKQFSENCKKL